MSFSWQNIAKLLVSLSIGILLIWYVQRDLTPEDKQVIIESITTAKWYILALASFMGIMAVIFRALRWKMLLEPLGYNPKIFTLIRIIFILYLTNLLFPRLGEILRCTLLKQYEDIPLEKSIGTMVMERMIDLVGMASIAGLALLIERDKFIQMYENYRAAQSASTGPSLMPWILGGIVVAMIVLFSIPKARNFIIEKVKGLMDGILSIRKLKNPLLFILYSASIYTMYLLITYVVYFAIEGTSHMSFSSSFLVVTTGTLGIGMTQGGLGAYQLLVTKTLELYDIPKSIGLAYSWISWLIQNLTLVFFGIISWVSLITSQRGQK